MKPRGSRTTASQYPPPNIRGLEPLLRSPSVVVRHTLVVVDPVSDILVDLSVEGSWRTRSDGQVDDGRVGRVLLGHRRRRNLGFQLLG